LRRPSFITHSRITSSISNIILVDQKQTNKQIICNQNMKENIIKWAKKKGWLAQLVERATVNRKATGSTPVSSVSFVLIISFCCFCWKFNFHIFAILLRIFLTSIRGYLMCCRVSCINSREWKDPADGLELGYTSTSTQPLSSIKLSDPCY
jgi:hypothetical protein